MMAPSIIGELPTLSICSTWRTPNFLSSSPHHPILSSYYGNYSLDSFSRIPKTQEVASQWSNIKAAKLIGTPTSKDEEVEQDEKVTTIRFLEFNFIVPLNHSDPQGKPLSLHAKLVYDHYLPGEAEPETRPNWKEVVQARKNPDLLLYLCGGPGDDNALKNPALKKAAMARGYYVLFVDYRGTGRSSAINKVPNTGAEYLAMFRQDNIVRDLEAIRLCLAKELLSKPKPEPELKFSLLGQSFGGWIILTYLSFLPSSLERVGIHAGLPPLDKAADDVYRETFKEVIKRNKDYYKEYPGDVDRVRDIVVKLEKTPHKYTPEADGIMHTVTGRTFLTIGRTLGVEGGGEDIHQLVECMFNDLKDGGKLSDETSEMYLKCLGFKLNERPLYGVMHESIYCSGSGASRWAAKRVALEEQGDKFSWIDDDILTKLESYSGELYFSGEMIYPFMLRYSGDALRAFEKVTEELACKRDWPELYDLEQLEKNAVEARAIVYPNDMYVAGELSDKTAKMVNGLEKVEILAGLGFSHKAIKDATKAADVFNKLFPLKGATR